MEIFWLTDTLAMRVFVAMRLRIVSPAREGLSPTPLKAPSAPSAGMALAKNAACLDCTGLDSAESPLAGVEPNRALTRLADTAAVEGRVCLRCAHTAEPA